MFQQTQKEIQIWHTQQGHTNETTQLNKLLEELGEVAGEIESGSEQALKTELGDVLIVLISLDMINENDQNLTSFLNVNLLTCDNKAAFLVYHMHNELKSCNTTAHGIDFVKRLGYDPTECLELAWQKEQVKTAKPKLIGGFSFINKFELLLNGLVVFGDDEKVNFMPEAPHQPRELKTSPVKLSSVEPNRWIVKNGFACLIIAIDDTYATYQAFELKENGGFEMRFCASSAGNTVDLIH